METSMVYFAAGIHKHTAAHFFSDKVRMLQDGTQQNIYDFHKTELRHTDFHMTMTSGYIFVAWGFLSCNDMEHGLSLGMVDMVLKFEKIR